MTQKDTKQDKKLTGASIAGSEHPQSISFPNGAVYNKAYLDMIVEETKQAYEAKIVEARIDELDLLEQAINQGRDMYQYKMQRLQKLLAQLKLKKEKH